MKPKTIAISPSAIFVIAIIAAVGKNILFVEAGTNSQPYGFQKRRSAILGSVKEGEWFSPNLAQRTLRKLGLLDFNKVCDSGLVSKFEVWAADSEFGTGCGISTCMCENYICVRCGDGKCGNGENKCNCPEDCK